MPRKSKKEKIIAELRRKVQIQQSAKSSIPAMTTSGSASAFRFQLKNTIHQPETKHKENTTDLMSIKRDLYKTFILAAVAIAAEVVIYFVKR